MIRNISNFKTLFQRELIILQRLAYKLNNQLRSQKEFGHLKEVIKTAKKIVTALGEEYQILKQQYNEKDVEMLLENLKKWNEVTNKFGNDMNLYIRRRFLLEFSTISFSTLARMNYLVEIFYDDIIKITGAQQQIHLHKKLNEVKQQLQQQQQQQIVQYETNKIDNFGQENQSNNQNIIKMEEIGNLYIRKISSDQFAKDEANVISEQEQQQQQENQEIAIQCENKKEKNRTERSEIEALEEKNHKEKLIEKREMANLQKYEQNLNYADIISQVSKEKQSQQQQKQLQTLQRGGIENERNGNEIILKQDQKKKEFSNDDILKIFSQNNNEGDENKSNKKNKPNQQKQQQKVKQSQQPFDIDQAFSMITSSKKIKKNLTQKK